MSLGYAERLSYKDDVGAVGMRNRPKEGSLDLRKKVVSPLSSLIQMLLFQLRTVRHAHILPSLYHFIFVSCSFDSDTSPQIRLLFSNHFNLL